MSSLRAVAAVVVLSGIILDSVSLPVEGDAGFLVEVEVLEAEADRLGVADEVVHAHRRALLLSTGLFIQSGHENALFQLVHSPPHVV